MRLAIIADIHSNVVALQTILDDIQKEGADQILCAGDIVGYGPRPDEAVTLLKKANVRSIKGNHDRAATLRDSSNMNLQAQDAIWWTIDHIKKETFDYLSELPANDRITLEGLRIGIYHGSPRHDDEYIYEEAAEEELLQEARSELLILGHTHIPYVVVLDSGTIVNPGSVGQPRDGDPRASYVLYDHRLRRFDVRRLEYDIKAVAQDMNEKGLPEFLSMRLFSGI